MNVLLTAVKFPGSTLTTMIVTALLCTAIPFLFLAYYHMKTNAKISSFFIGMGYYALFYFVAQGLLNVFLFQICHLRDSFNMSTRPVWYALYGAFAAGGFGSLGKIIGLRYAMKKRTGKENGLVFGAGYGAFETIAFGSSMVMGNIVLAFMVNSMGMEEYITKLGLTGQELAEFQAGLSELAAVPSIQYASQGTQQILTLFFQTSLAILLYLAIHGEKRSLYYPLSILLEILYYVPVYLSRAGLFKNSLLSLALTGGIAILTAAYAYRMYFSFSDET